MRHLLRYIALFLLISSPAVAQTSRQWWYPLGPPEGTRRLLGLTKHQTADSLIIKWRTKAIRNSQILVGSLQPEPNRPVGTLQVVGLVGDTLTILSSRGEVLHRNDLKSFLQDGWKPALTGLFDPLAIGVSFTSTPRMIGIGVEGTVDPTIAEDPYALVTSFDGSPVARIYYHIPTDNNAANRSARIYPVGAFSRGTDQLILTMVSQDQFQFHGVRPENGLKRYLYDGSSAVHQSNGDYDYPVAPMALSQQPAMLYDERTNSNYVVINTATYPTPPQFSTRTPSPAPVNWMPTYSDTMYSIDLSVNAVPMTNIGTRKVDPTAPGTVQGTANTTIATLSRRQGNAGFYRIVTENHDPGRPGIGSIILDTLFTDPTPSRKGIFIDQAAPATNLGWTIAVADLDAKAPGASGRNNNPGDEIVAAWRAPDGGDLETNWLYALQFPTTVAQKDTLNIIAKQRFSGRLMAAGDLIADTNDRYELVIAHGDTLSILQMKDYSSNNDFNPLVVAEKRHPFSVMKSFVLDDEIVSVALADLEADEENDIIVCTKSSTYAIGLPLAQPFDKIAVSSTTYCEGDSGTVSWGHAVGGGDAGLSITLRSPSHTVLVAAHRAAGRSDSIRFGTEGLTDKVYRLFVSDEDAPSVVDSSAVIIVNPHAITTIDGVRADSVYRFGDQLTITGHAECFAGNVKIEQRRGASGWDSIPAVISPDGTGRYTATFPLHCPNVSSCEIGIEDTLRFRFAGTEGDLQSLTIAVRVDNQARELGVHPGDDSSRARHRVVTWNSGAFDCDSVEVSMSLDNGTTWKELDVVPASLGAYSVEAPIEPSGTVSVCVHCNDISGTACAIGRAVFTTLPLADNFVAPNPFDPARAQNDITGHGALISYHLDHPASVNITIYDAARTVVRRLEEERPGLTTWDGTNSRGEIVANGTYICVIQPSSEEPIILPIVVLKR